jgi:Alpha/beta hydrolase domain
MQRLWAVGARAFRRGIPSKLLATAAVLAVWALVGAYGGAQAAVTSVSVLSSTQLGDFDHRDYREVQIRMRGSAPGGAYDVPVTLAFPEQSKDYSGVAVVDVINTSYVTAAVVPAPATRVPLPLARIQMGDEYLFGSGHVYVSVHWEKTAVELLGIGVIAAPGDAFTILRDAAALARDPGAVPSSVRPQASQTVVAYGFSQSGRLLRGFYHSHQNTVGGLAFDGALYGGAQAGCFEPPLAFICNGTVSDGGKVIAFATETDSEVLAGFLERGETSDYRFFDIAGTSHIPAAVVHFFAAPNQNPIAIGPAVRAALRNLVAWIDGTEPPSSTYIELQPVVPGAPFRSAVRDADGNAIGGLRLPHMTATDQSGEVGAPLGAYEGLDLSQTSTFLRIGGHFTPFDSEKLESLYPTHDIYVERVARAAHRLVQRRELLQDDAKAYIKEAAQSEIGK